MLIFFSKKCNTPVNLLIKAVGIHGGRANYCRPLKKSFLLELNEKQPTTLDEIGEIWYQRSAENFPSIHYHESRYHTLNLHALFTKGTIEFRLFNGTLDAGEIETALQFCSALVASARKAKWTIYRPIETENEKSAMRAWICRDNGINFNGRDFATARHHLLKRLTDKAEARRAV